MKLMRKKWFDRGIRLGVSWMAMLCAMAGAQGLGTTVVQGTVYLANGTPGSGTLTLSWPAFTTASGQTVVAGVLNEAIGADGSVSVNLAPNLGATPAGLFYTAVYHMSDGSVSTEYWVVAATTSATLAQVRAQVMPAAQAMQAVSKAYVDEAIASLAAGTSMGPRTTTQLGAVYQADQFAGADAGVQINACLAAAIAAGGGTCDARALGGTRVIGEEIELGSETQAASGTVSVELMLPCRRCGSSTSRMACPAGSRSFRITAQWARARRAARCG